MSKYKEDRFGQIIYFSIDAVIEKGNIRNSFYSSVRWFNTFIPRIGERIAFKEEYKDYIDVSDDMLDTVVFNLKSANIFSSV